MNGELLRFSRLAVYLLWLHLRKQTITSQVVTYSYKYIYFDSYDSKQTSIDLS